jgi:hypothetical protein
VIWTLKLPVFRFAPICLLLLGFSSRAADFQAVATAAEPPWGEVVEGIQLRLTEAPKLPSSPTPTLAQTLAQLPALQVEIRNQGTKVVTFDRNDLSQAAIEIDGVTYIELQGGSSFRRSEEIEPGGHRGPFTLMYFNLYSGAGARTGADGRVQFTAGPHTVRLRSRIGRNYDLRQPQLRPPTVDVASNLLTITVPAVDAAAKR